MAFTFDANNNLNVTGTISASNPSVGTTGATAPTSATEIAIIDGTGKLQGVSSTNPVPTTFPAGTAVELLDSGGVNKASISAAGAQKVDGSAVTQPVSGTITANAGTNLNTSALALDATLTGGTQKTKIVDTGGVNVASVSAAGAVKVDGSAVTQPVSGTFFQGTQPVSGTVTANQGTAAVVTAGWPTTDGQTAETTTAWTSATGVNTTLALTITGYGTVTVALNQGSTITGGVVTFEVSDTVAGTNWYTIQGAQIQAFSAAGTYTLQQSINQAFQFDVSGFVQFRVRLSTVITGTGTVNVGIAAQSTASENAITIGGTVTANAGSGNFGVNLAQVAGTATGVAVAGVQLVGIEGRAGTSLETTAGVLDQNLVNLKNTAIVTSAAGVQRVGIAGNTNATLDSTAAAGTAPTNALLTSTIFNTTIPAPTAGQALANQSDSTGSLFVNTEGRKATYRANLSGGTLGSGQTFTFFGSATKTVRISRIRCSVNSVTATPCIITVTKFSSAPTGGTSTTITQIPLDANSSAGTATNVNNYTVIASGGLASVGVLDLDTLISAGTTTPVATSGDNTYDMIYSQGGGVSQVVLRGVAQGIGLSFNQTTTTARGFIEWTEE